MQLSKNLQIGLVIALEVALCVLFWFYYYTPKTAEIANLEAEVDRMRREKREIELTKKLLAETLKENERLRTEIEHLERFFPEELYIPTVLLQIEHLALATQLNIGKITPKGTAVQRTEPASATPAPTAQAQAAQAEDKKYSFDPNREYKKSIIDFDVTGNYQAILNFFSELTAFPKLVVIEKMGINNTGGKSDEKQGQASAGNLKVSMPLTFYIQQKKGPLVLEQEQQGGKEVPKGSLQAREFDETKSTF
ncbi:MAG: hypothetical protein ABIH66_03315 [bacterium]